MIEQRNLLLVPFPFSDQSGRKVRPVVVVSNNDFNEYGEDIIVVAVTSKITKEKYTVFLSPDDMEEGSLRHNCCIKVENILKMDKKLIMKKIGKVKQTTFQKAIVILDSIIKE